MNRFVCTLAFATVVAMPAFADEPSGSAQPAAATPSFTAPHDWTGFYIGANAGYIRGITGFAGGRAAPTIRDDAFVGGVQAGHDWQLGRLVVGMEADYQASGLSARYSEPDGSITATLDHLATLRARIGMSLDGFMPYLTGGIAYGRNQIRADEDGVAVGIRKDHFGWTVGAGLEARLTAGWSVRTEYFYAGLGRRMYNRVIADGNDTTEFSVPARPEAHIARIAVNYRF